MTVDFQENHDFKLIFEGEYLNGKKWNGKGYDKEKIIYELKDGKGFINDYIKSYLGVRPLIIEGEYINGESNGKIKEYISNSLIFEGEYLNGKKKWKRKRIQG